MKKFFCVLCGICLFYMGYAQEKEVKAVIETNLGNMIVKLYNDTPNHPHHVNPKHRHTPSIMDAARAAGAGGGTVIHAKGTGMEGAAHFMGVELVNEKELVLIVSRTTLKNQIMQAIMQGADPKAGAIVFSLPVTDTAGLRLLDEE